MREIKFRGWDKEQGKMLEDFEWLLDPSVYMEGTRIIAHSRMRPIGSKVMSRIEIMQFTGLLDKNGKEIYEGDIIQNVSNDGIRLSKFEIKWNEDACRFSKHRNDGNVYDFEKASVSLCEIIGNIYENPELLKQTA